MATTATTSNTATTSSRERRVKLRKSAEDLFLVTVRMEPAGFGLMLDVSEGGLGVQVMNKIAPGTNVALNFTVPNTNKKVEGTGVVSWYDGQGRVGVHFQQLRNDSGDTLRQWVSTLPALPVRESSGRAAASAPRPAAIPTATPAPAIANLVPAPRPPASLKEQVRSIREQINAKHLELDLVLQFLVEKVTELTKSSGGAIALGTADDMLCRASTGMAPEVGVRIGSGSALTAECLRTSKIVSCDDTEADYRVDRDVCRQLNLRAVLIFPILREGKVGGVLEVFSPSPNSYGEQQFSMLQQLADFTAEIVYGVEIAKAPRPVAEVQPKFASAAVVAAAVAPSVIKPVVVPQVVVPQVVKTPEQPRTSPQQPPPRTLTAPVAAAPAKAAIADVGSIMLRPTKTAAAIGHNGPVADLAFLDEPEQRRNLLTPVLIGLALFLVVATFAWRYYAQPKTSSVSRTVATVSEAPATSSAAVPSTDDALPSNTAPIVTGSTKSSSVPRPKNSQGSTAIDVADDTVTPVNPPPPPARTTEQPIEAPAIAGMPPTTSFPSVALPAFVNTPQLKVERKAGGNLTGGVILRRVAPVYPKVGREQHYEGNVELSARITKTGSVENVKRLSGNPVLGNAAVLAVRQWKYEPYKLNGIPQDVDTTITVHFQLK